MITFDEGAEGRTVDLKPGEEFELVLPENPTTGHRWRVESAGAPVCAAVDDAYEAPHAAAPGRGGAHRWRFRCERAGTGVVALSLLRTWEKASPGARTFRIEVRVPRD
jgi:inhibitor of cysteine peptidase